MCILSVFTSFNLYSPIGIREVIAYPPLSVTIVSTTSLLEFITSNSTPSSLISLFSLSTLYTSICPFNFSLVIVTSVVSFHLILASNVSSLICIFYYF